MVFENTLSRALLQSKLLAFSEGRGSTSCSTLSALIFAPKATKCKTDGALKQLPHYACKRVVNHFLVSRVQNWSGLESRKPFFELHSLNTRKAFSSFVRHGFNHAHFIEHRIGRVSWSPTSFVRCHVLFLIYVPLLHIDEAGQTRACGRRRCFNCRTTSQVLLLL